MDKEYLMELRKKVSKIKVPGEIEQIMKHKTSYERFKEKALEIPNKIFAKYFGNNITYKQALEMIDNSAKGFSEIGIKYDDIVAVSLLGTPYGVIIFYALDKIGSCMHMVNFASGLEEVKRELTNIPSKFFVGNDIFFNEKSRILLNECGIEKIIATSLTDCLPKILNSSIIKYHLIEKLKGIKKTEYNGITLLNFEQILNIGKHSLNDIPSCKYKKNKKAVIAYTSGSEGTSKPCVASWDGIDSMVQIMALTEEGRFQEGDTMFTTFPLWIFYSLLNMIHEPTCLGVSLAFDPLFNPKDMIKRNDLYHFNHWLTMPSILKKAIENGIKTDCSKWKIVLTGGGALTNEIKAKADKYIKNNNGSIKVNQGYGATEMLGSFSYGYNENCTMGSVGIPCVGNYIKIIDPSTNKVLGPNEMGVAHLYSPTRMMEYYNNAEATKKSLVKDENGVLWYNSEDLMYVNEKNEIFLDDRYKKMVTTYDKDGNPTKLIPGRIKRAISSLNYINDCEVITIPDDKKDNVAILFVISNEKNEDLLKENLLEYCMHNIPEYMIPVDICLLKDFPLTSAKKIDYAELLKLYRDKLLLKSKKDKIKVKKY